MKLEELDLNKTYTYADYLTWTFEETVELIKGKIFKMCPAPNTYHQETSSNLLKKLFYFFGNKQCKPDIFPERNLAEEPWDEHYVRM